VLVPMVPDVSAVLVLLVDAQPAKNMKLAIRIATFCIDLLLWQRGAHSPKLLRFGVSPSLPPREGTSARTAP